MKKAPIHPHETERIKSLGLTNILDTLPEKDFDEITMLATQICNTPIALISLIDETRQWFKSKIGIKESETSRDLAFCAHAILQDDVFLVPDATKDDRFFDNPLVTGDIKIQFYAGAPLMSPEGVPIGTVCVIDTKPRELNDGQKNALKALSNQVSRLLELRARLTVFKELESVRRNLEMKLVESARLSILGEMASGIAHEINNPLAIILGKSQLLMYRLEKGSLNLDTDLRHFQTITNTCERIAKIIRGLRTYSRDAENDPFESVNLITIIQDTLELCNERFKYEEFKIHIECPADIKLECRAPQISQVLMNLFTNAFDAVIELPEKWIHINVKTIQNVIKMSFTDSGRGVSPLVAKKMMQPFYTTKDIGKGTGLGLSISKGIIENHHGTLTYEPDSEHTTFVLNIPMFQPSTQTKAS